MDTIIINGKSYEEGFVEKAINFYELLLDGSIKEQIKEEMQCVK